MNIAAVHTQTHTQREKDTRAYPPCFTWVYTHTHALQALHLSKWDHGVCVCVCVCVRVSHRFLPSTLMAVDDVGMALGAYRVVMGLQLARQTRYTHTHTHTHKRASPLSVCSVRPIDTHTHTHTHTHEPLLVLFSERPTKPQFSIPSLCFYL